MTEQNIIQTVVKELKKYPGIKFSKKNDSELKIFGRENTGFDILLLLGGRDNMLYFGPFHWHFDNSEEEINEMLDYIAFGLAGIARLKEYSIKGKGYKWTIQMQDQDGNWLDDETMALMNIKFNAESDVKYLQNEIIPKDILYDDSETNDLK
ncbi:hypothetical protein ABE426_19050 [Sphingobacterium faecium]|uniref:hypothetical protein n=1 Tax=Sphingobacterium faecium TaxID=34087 RepID=UPI003207F315